MKTNRDMVVCRKVIYSGQVQGVGFRYTARRLAGGLQVTGYVKNLPGGEVELVAQGEPSEVESLLDRIAQRMGGYIHSAEITEQATQSFRGFGISY